MLRTASTPDRWLRSACRERFLVVEADFELPCGGGFDANVDGGDVTSSRLALDSKDQMELALTVSAAMGGEFRLAILWSLARQRRPDRR